MTPRAALAIVAVLALGCGESRPAARTQSQPITPTAAAPTPPPGPYHVTLTSAASLDPSAPLQIESLGAPVRSSRAWTSALSPNPRGGWNFIAQTFEHGADQPPEFVVVDLQTGAYSIFQSEPRARAIEKYSYKNQLRAPNGRIFFPQAEMRMSYYDPKDESIKDMGRIIDPPRGNSFPYALVFGPDGKLYAGTMSNSRPTLVQIDPDTLQRRVLGEVGSARPTYAYAYQVAVDPPWVYTVVGQVPWELVAVNIKTGENRILATRTDHPWMALLIKPEGILVELISGLRTPQQKKDLAWCIDGKIVPYGSTTPARNVKPATGTLSNAPELDITKLNPDHRGVARVSWRKPGADWKQVDVRVQHVVPIPIESLSALPDGTVLGNTKQYHGYFRFDPRIDTSDFWGPHGPSRPVTAWLDGRLYIAGYPNSVLFAYDPKAAWTAKHPNDTVTPGSNPLWLGTFSESRAKYASVMIAAGSRLYYAGRRERDGIGGGVGYFEPKSHRFGGHADNLEWLEPQGLAVVDKRVVLSGRLTRDAAPNQRAELVIFDEELKLVERQPVRQGISETGELFAGPDGSVIGIVRGLRSIYRHDVRTKQLVAWREHVGSIGAASVRGDGSIWVVIDRRLARLDPKTLDTTVFGGSELPFNVDHLAWVGDDLYFTVAADLMRIRRVGQF